MENTSGFYKYESENLMYGQNYVLNANYELRTETKDEHTYPTDGWYWFDSIEEARLLFNIPEPAPVEEPVIPFIPGLPNP